MTIPRFTRTVILLAVFLPCSLAQAAPETVPAGNNTVQTANPAVAQPPRFCRWTMAVDVFSPSGTAQKKVVTVTQSGEIASQKVEENGKSLEVFRVGPVEYKTAGGPEEGAFVPPGSVAIEDGSFPEFAWVEKRFLLGTMMVQNQRCNVYADIHGKRVPESGEPAQKLASLLQELSAKGSPGKKQLPGIITPAFLAEGIRIACLDAETHLPVLIQNGFEIRSYAFTRVTPQDLMFPKKVRDMVEVVVKTNKALFAPFARP